MDFSRESKAHQMGYSLVAGIDEAGRGPLAGPVVAAACILPQDFVDELGINDSKKLSPQKRKTIYEALLNSPSIHIGIAEVSPQEIDELNILGATLYAMRKAVEKLPHVPSYLLVDGNADPKISIPTETVVKGDSLSYSIAAASILAKEYRDALMQELDKTYPGYGFKDHMGYPTRKHLEAIENLGVTPMHRKSFAPVRKALEAIYA